jgi:hypothetical protein
MRPHIAKNRMQIALAVSAIVAASHIACVRSCRVMMTGVGLALPADLI